MMNANKLQHSINPTVKHQTKESRPRFRLNVKTELSDAQEIPKVFQYHVDWGDISITPLLNVPREILKILHIVCSLGHHILVVGNLQLLLLVDTLK